MCLKIDKNLHCYNKPRIADKDLVCYKVLLQKGRLFKRFYSPCYYFKWKKNVEYTTEMNVPFIIHGEHFVEEGFHAFISKEPIAFEDFPFINKILVECIIPKGSEYYIGECNDIVSNKMKFVKILK